MNDRFQLSHHTFSTCRRLLVPSTTAATAVINLHRFLNAKDSSEYLGYDWRVLISAVVFMSCKQTENQKQFRDVYNVASKVIDFSTSVEELDSKYCTRKEQIIQLEQNILRTLNFDIDFELPHKYVLNISRFMKFPPSVVQAAMCVLNDALLCKECATTAPEITAVACLLLGQTMCGTSYAPPYSSTATEVATNIGDNSSNSKNDGQNSSGQSAIAYDESAGAGDWWRRYFGVTDEALSTAMRWITDVVELAQQCSAQSVSNNSSTGTNVNEEASVPVPL